MIKIYSKFINNTRDIITSFTSSRIYKIYKLYKNSIKLLSIINIFVLLYYTIFQINFDYLAFICIITSILDKLTFSPLAIGKEFTNYFKKMFFTDNLVAPQANDYQISNHKVEASLQSPVAKGESNYEDKIESVKDQSYNKVKFICITIIGLGVCAYISWDLYTHGVIYTTISSIYNSITYSKDDGDDVSSNFDDSDSNASSIDSTSTLVAHTDVLEQGITVENLVNVNFWGTHIEIPAGSKIILSVGNNLIYKTPDNNVFNYIRTPLGILSSVND
jgi:hypothetical protein